MKTRRSALVLVCVVWTFILATFAFEWFTLGPGEGTIVVAPAFAFVAAVFVIARAGSRRRVRRVAASHPGWKLLPAATSSTEVAAMRAAGKRFVLQGAATLGWSASGVGLWAPSRRGFVTLFQYSWPEVAEVVEAVDLRNMRGYPVPGIRIRAVDGTVHDVLVVASRPLRAAHVGATRAGAVALDMLDTRGGVASLPSWP